MPTFSLQLVKWHIILVHIMEPEDVLVLSKEAAKIRQLRKLDKYTRKH